MYAEEEDPLHSAFYLLVEIDPGPELPDGENWQPYAGGWWRVAYTQSLTWAEARNQGAAYALLYSDWYPQRRIIIRPAKHPQPPEDEPPDHE